MDISLEKIDMIRERTGLNYAEAKELLEEANGDVVNALVILDEEDGVFEEAMDIDTQEVGEMLSHNVFDPVKRVIHKGNRTRIRVRNDEGTLLEIPATLGIAGALLAPRATAFSAMALLLAHYTLEVEPPEFEMHPMSTQQYQQ